MQTVVYGDVLFLVDASIDFLVLTLVGCFFHLPRRALRILAAAILGGIYSVLSLFFSLSFFSALVLNIAVAAILCAVAYAPLPWRDFFKLVLAFYAVAVLLGGAVSALFSALADFFDTDGAVGVAVDGKAALVFLLYAAVSALLIFGTGHILSRIMDKVHFGG